MDISDEVLAYEPTYEDLIETVPDGRYARKIYYGVELNDQEQEDKR